MTTITGQLFDSLGQELEAEIYFQTVAPVFPASASPKPIVLPYENVVTTDPDGSFTITGVPPTEPDGVAMKVTIKPLSVAGNEISFLTSIPDFNVDLADLLPTSFTTDRGISSAVRIAKFLLESPQLQPVVVEGLGISRQATPPTVQAGRVWLDTQKGILYTPNPADTVWLTSPQVSSYGIFNQGSPPEFHYFYPKAQAMTVAYQIYEVSLYWSVLPAHDGTNNWQLRLGYLEAGSSTPVYWHTAKPTFDANTVNGKMQVFRVRPDNLVLAEDLRAFVLQVVDVGSPGNLSVYASVSHRCVTQPDPFSATDL